VDDGTNRDVSDRQAVAGLDVRGCGRYDLVADLQTLGSEDICLNAILVLDERDVSRTIGIVLQGHDGSGHLHLLTLEVDDTVLLLVAAAMMTDGDAAVAVAAGGLLELYEKALLGLHLRQTLERQNGHVSAGRGRRVESLDRHLISTP